MVKSPKFPLSADMLNTIKGQIRRHLEAFATDKIPMDRIGASQPGGRPLVIAFSWPIEEAIEYFEKEGVGKREGDIFKVFNMDYFDIELQSISVPITFSVDEHIRSDLAVMIDMYAQIYDIENRLRFFFFEKLKSFFGNDYLQNLPNKTRENIEQEKRRLRVSVNDSRSYDLQYAYFGDLKRILTNTPGLIDDVRARDLLLAKLDSLLEARNYVAHNNLLVPAEVKRISADCDAVRRIIEHQ